MPFLQGKHAGLHNELVRGNRRPLHRGAQPPARAGNHRCDPCHRPQVVCRVAGTGAPEAALRHPAEVLAPPHHQRLRRHAVREDGRQGRRQRLRGLRRQDLGREAQRVLRRVPQAMRPRHDHQPLPCQQAVRRGGQGCNYPERRAAFHVESSPQGTPQGGPQGSEPDTQPMSTTLYPRPQGREGKRHPGAAGRLRLRRVARMDYQARQGRRHPTHADGQPQLPLERNPGQGKEPPVGNAEPLRLAHVPHKSRPRNRPHGSQRTEPLPQRPALRGGRRVLRGLPRLRLPG